jgi:cell pole-organizing protein PopZ
MAQQAGNPQREPSMDEILASIRRIIEESEPERPGVDLSAIERLAADPAPIGPAANDPARREQTIALSEPTLVAPVELNQAPEAAAKIEMEDELLSESFDTDSFVLDRELDSAFRAIESVPAVEPEMAAEIPEIEPEAAHREPEPAVLGSVLSEAMGARIAEQQRSIISERTGRQVAQSFGDLADAFAASRRRSFDEMAEDMIRPMLQDWMDNNLPVLVERLVREEIERVARGG